MLRFIIRRLALSIITLFLLVIIVFLLTSVFPNDPARQLLGPFQSQEAVDQLAEELGLNDPKTEQLGRLVKGVATGDFGESYSRPGERVMDLILPALGNSAKLVVLGLLITLPLSILSGVLAAYRKDSLFDRSVVTLGLATSAIPDFVSGILLQYVIGVRLGWLPATSNAPRGTGFIGSLEFIILPALAIVLVYFGYIARVTRAGAVQAFESDYVRTAFMKGMPLRRVINRHVLRNSLQPTVAVIGTQIGFLFGGLIALELVFNYPGLGSMIINAAQDQDLPLLQGGVIIVAVLYMIATLLADLLISWMNPRARSVTAS